MQASEKKKRGGKTRTSWAPGTSGNPLGRKPSGFAASEKIRERLDLDEWIDFELQVARDVKEPIDRRACAWRALIDRAFVRPATGIDVRTTSGDAPARDLSSVPTDELEAKLAWLRALPTATIDTEQRLQEPPLPDDEKH